MGHKSLEKKERKKERNKAQLASLVGNHAKQAHKPKKG